jgi:hypothetical protein
MAGGGVRDCASDTEVAKVGRKKSRRWQKSLAPQFVLKYVDLTVLSATSVYRFSRSMPAREHFEDTGISLDHISKQ